MAAWESGGGGGGGGGENTCLFFPWPDFRGVLHEVGARSFQIGCVQR